MDTRRSAAVQFFMETDSENDGLSADYKQVVQWLNEAMMTTDATRLDHLRRVKEIILNKDPNLLDNFLDEVLSFQHDKNAEVKKFIISFIEDALKTDPDILPRVASNLARLAQDPTVQVQKRIIQAASSIYRNTLAWLAKARTVTEEMEGAWILIGTIKSQIVSMIDSENDGIRTQSVKFLENVVLLQTYPDPDSLKKDSDFSLEDVPLTLKIARRRKLEEEANTVFELLIKFLNSPHISSINLMTCVASLLTIAKMRPKFMSQTITTIEKLRNNLPPTLSQSQIVSATKHIKMQLLQILKHPSSTEFHQTITALLTDLGATSHEINKSYPQLSELRRRQKRIAETQAAMSTQSKRPRYTLADDSEDSDDDFEEEDLTPLNERQTMLAVGLTETFIMERLSVDIAARLIVNSISKLPDTMPAHFSSQYSPIAEAGTVRQIKVVSHLLAMQLTIAGLGPGVKQARRVIQADKQPEVMEVTEEVTPIIIKIKEEPKDKPAAVAPGVPKAKPRVKTLKLSEITKPMPKDVASRMMASAVGRILRAENAASTGGVSAMRNKMIVTLAATFNDSVRQVVMSHILQDIRTHIDLCLGWLYEEYSFVQGFNRVANFLKPEQSHEFNYNQLLCRLVASLIAAHDCKDRDMLLVRLYLESPLITEEATNLLKAMCGDQARASIGLPLLQELVTRRPPRQLNFLNALLEHTAHENDVVRGMAINCIVALYDRGELHSIVEEYSILYLGFLRLNQPPAVLFGSERGRPNRQDAWTEDLVRACLYLYLALLPINHSLIQELARVYVQTVADVKRAILRLLDQPVRSMGMDSTPLLSLVEECPKGAETLITRVIQILTDKTPPSAQLVDRVRELYKARVSDVRFLIPVINGLTKKEVIAALPRLIKLNPIVVKEVFNKLLGTHSDATSHASPVTPADLLIALHTIDPTKAELKNVIKATSLCFAETQAYPQEVLAVVMQNLMEVTPLPTLLMRTVIQSLALYPRLLGLVMNILQRLIVKQVWKQKKVWEGFIKCCERTQPQSYQVVLQLPAPQLRDLLASAADMQTALLAHVTSFTENQLSHLPPASMDVLRGVKSGAGYDLGGDVRSPTSLMIDTHDEPAPPGME